MHAVDLAVERRFALVGGFAKADSLRADRQRNLVAGLVAIKACPVDCNVFAINR